MTMIDPDQQQDLQKRNQTSGVVQQVKTPIMQSPVDEWLAMGQMLVTELREKQKFLTEQLAEVNKRLRQLNVGTPAATISTPEGVVTATKPVYKKREHINESNQTMLERVQANTPKIRAEAKTSTEIAKIMGVEMVVVQKALSFLNSKNLVERARSLDTQGFRYWCAK